MDQKTKFILIGLIGLSVIFSFLFIQTLNSKQVVLKERDELKKENASLASKLKKIESALSDYENKVSILNSDLDRVSKEKQELDRKYELVNKEKGALLEKLKAKQEEAYASSPAVQPAPAPDTDSYWAGILKAKTDLEMQLANLRSELKSTQINNEQLQREKSSLELDLNNLSREKDDLKRQLEYNQKLMDSIAQELVRERNDKLKIQDALKPIKNENSVLLRQLKSLNTRKINLDKRIQGLMEDKSTLERRFTEMETMLTEKVGQINELKDQIDKIRSSAKIGAPVAPADKKEPAQSDEPSVELAPIVVRPQAGQAGQKDTVVSLSRKIEGRVLAINKDSNFVIIDLGEDAGIRLGNNFTVYKDSSAPIAEIEVIQLRKSIAACDIKNETEPIKIGDRVR